MDPAGDGAFHAKYRVIRRDGSERHATATGQVFFEAGRAVRMVGAVRDVTAKRRLERKLRQQRSELESLVKQQVAAQTAAAIAHDLNQPLLSISAYNDAALRMLRRGLTTSDKLIHAIEASAQQAQRAGSTLHELSDFLHSGDIIVAPVDINAIVLNAIESARDVGCDGFRPIVSLEPDLPPVLGNRLQLQKVLVNLIHNGVEAMRDAGAEGCSIAITVRALEGRDFAQISVRDGGPGLDAATAARIFDPFFTTKSTGIGLGLAISRALIEAHDGKLWVDANEGAGATFHCTLPFAP
jgi:signal transduction histidine kinase